MFSRPKKGSSDVIAIDLKAVCRLTRDRIEHIQQQDVSPALIVARLADAYRDAELQPLPPAQVYELLDKLDEEGWRRLDLVVSVLVGDAVRSVLKKAKTRNDIVDQISNVFLPLVEKKRSVTLAMTSESPLRIEEFVRSLAAGLKAGIIGETPDQSIQRLARLDYERLLIDAELSRLSGKERSEYFVALHKAERGKW